MQELDAIRAVRATDPYPYYATLARQEAPVWDEGLRLWIAASPALVEEVMRHPACRVRPLAEPVPRAIAGGSAGEVFAQLVRMNDGERHAAPKLALQRALASSAAHDAAPDERGCAPGPAAAPCWRGDATARAATRDEPDNGACHAVAPGGRGRTADAVWAMRPPGLGSRDEAARRPAPEVRQRARAVAQGLLAARPLRAWAFEAPVSVVASLLGFPAAQLPAVARWARDFVACLSPLSSPAQIDAAHAASLHLLAAMRELLQAAPAGSLAAAVAQEARAAGWGNDHAIVANLVGLLSQAYEATAGLLGNSLVAMQRGADCTDAHALVQQVMRDDPPIHNTRRFAAARCDIGGVTVEEGQAILVVLAAARRGFGHGAHACPGQQLALDIAAGCLDALAGKVLPQLAWTYRASVNARIPEFE